MQVDGQCHCGALKYEADVNPNGVVICHCTDCQQLSGSAYRTNIPIAAAKFRFTEGSPRTYTKTAASGAKRVHAFCEICGSQIYSTNEGAPIAYSLRIGGITQRAQFKPALRIWASSTLPWSLDIAAVPARDGQ